MERRLLAGVAVLAAWLSVTCAEAQTHEYQGIRVCTKCHQDQGNAWRTTAHAKAYESLKAGVKAEAKVKAGLDAKEDYTRNKDCLGCHTTGFDQPGGFRIGIDGEAAAVVIGVGCESCHGPGGRYRMLHGDASDRLKSSGATTPRTRLAEAGQDFGYEEACARCHLNHPGSGWTGVKMPHTPFTPAIDSKYRLDFRKAALAGERNNPIHVHYKLRGVFAGEPVPPIRAEVQANALEIED